MVPGTYIITSHYHPIYVSVYVSRNFIVCLLLCIVCNGGVLRCPATIGDLELELVRCCETKSEGGEGALVRVWFPLGGRAAAEKGETTTVTPVKYVPSATMTTFGLCSGPSSILSSDLRDVVTRFTRALHHLRAGTTAGGPPSRCCCSTRTQTNRRNSNATTHSIPKAAIAGGVEPARGSAVGPLTDV